MRRSFKDDKVYATIFKKYVQNLVTYGNSPFEFFIEGTRSRCGKSLMPKLGKVGVRTFECFETNEFRWMENFSDSFRFIENDHRIVSINRYRGYYLRSNYH